MESFGRYQLQEQLGQGGMGVVYRAFDTTLERTVALKLVLPDVLDDELRARLFREARAAGNLKHKNIVTIYDLGEHDGRPYLAMEYLEGEDLQRRLSRPEKMALLHKLDLAIEVCGGLAYAHAHGVIHRDVKPANLFILDSGGAKIVDFGLARLMTSQLTRSNMLMGTLNYMAPEQVRGERADKRSDIFSTGVVLYELLGGLKAFDGDTVASTLYKILQEVPQPLWKLDAALPRDLAHVVERMLAKLPDERFQTMDEVCRELEICRDRYRAGGRSTPVPVQLSPAFIEEAQSRTLAPVRFGTPSGSMEGEHTQSPRPPQSSAGVTAPAAPAPASAPRGNHFKGAMAAAALVAVAAGGLWWFASHAGVRASQAAARSAAAPGSAPARERATSAPVPERRAGERRGVALKEEARADARRRFARDDQPATTTEGSRPSGRPTPEVKSPRRASRTSPIQVPVTVPEPSASAPFAVPSSLPATPGTTPPASAGAAPAPSTPASPSESARVARARPPAAPPGSASPAATPVAASPSDAASVVEAQENIAALLDQYRQALETKSMDQLKRIWPSLSGSAEAAIRQEFNHAASITVGIENPQIAVSGASAQVRFTRSYSLVTMDGQHLQSTTRAFIEARKAGAAWIIGAIRFSER